MLQEKLLDKKEVCEFLNIRPSTLDVLLAKRKIPVVRFNRKVLFDPEDVRRFVKEHTLRPSAK